MALQNTRHVGYSDAAVVAAPLNGFILRSICLLELGSRPPLMPRGLLSLPDYM
jgi:hypothetical protein